MSDIVLDLDKTITAAVNARVEAEMMKALSGDETIGAFVTAALRQTIEVTASNGYGKERVPFLTATLRNAIRAATKDAVQRFIAEEMESIESEVRKALRRNLASIADALTTNIVEGAKNGYGISVNLAIKTRDY